MCPVLVESSRLRRPRTEGSADLPLVTERINYPTDPSTVLVVHWGRFAGADTYCSVQHRLRIVDH